MHQERLELFRDRRSHQADVDLQIRERLELIRAHQLGQLRRHCRRALPDHREEVSQYCVRPDRGERDAQRSGLTVGRPPSRLGSDLEEREHSSAVFEEHRAGRSEPHSPPGPVEQRDVERALQALDLPGQRRLGHRQPLGGPAEVLLLGDRDESLQLLQREVHAMPPRYRSMRKWAWTSITESAYLQSNPTTTGAERPPPNKESACRS